MKLLTINKLYFLQEITLWRKGEKAYKAGLAPSPHVPTHLVSSEGGPRGSEPILQSPPPSTAPIEDMKREDESPSTPPQEQEE